MATESLPAHEFILEGCPSGLPPFPGTSAYSTPPDPTSPTCPTLNDENLTTGSASSPPDVSDETPLNTANGSASGITPTTHDEFPTPAAISVSPQLGSSEIVDNSIEEVRGYFRSCFAQQIEAIVDQLPPSLKKEARRRIETIAPLSLVKSGNNHHLTIYNPEDLLISIPDRKLWNVRHESSVGHLDILALMMEKFLNRGISGYGQKHLEDQGGILFGFKTEEELAEFAKEYPIFVISEEVRDGERLKYSDKIFLASYIFAGGLTGSPDGKPTLAENIIFHDSTYNVLKSLEPDDDTADLEMKLLRQEILKSLKKNKVVYSAYITVGVNHPVTGERSLRKQGFGAALKAAGYEFAKEVLDMEYALLRIFRLTGVTVRNYQEEGHPVTKTLLIFPQNIRNEPSQGLNNVKGYLGSLSGHEKVMDMKTPTYRDNNFADVHKHLLIIIREMLKNQGVNFLKDFPITDDISEILNREGIPDPNQIESLASRVAFDLTTEARFDYYAVPLLRGEAINEQLRRVVTKRPFGDFSVQG